MIAVLITPMITNSPPAILETERKNPRGVEAAVKHEITSGAPLPRAKRVTPANVSLIQSF